MASPITAVSEHRGVIATMADNCGMDPVAFERTMRATVFPADASKEELAAFLLVARTYELDPLVKQIYAFKNRSGGIVPIVPIDGWVALVNRHPQFDGVEFVDKWDASKGLAAITCRMYRKDRAKPVEVTEYMEECVRPTDPWKQWPGRMLRHKAYIQCARYAFGVSGVHDPDEGERFAEREVRGERLVDEPINLPTERASNGAAAAQTNQASASAPAADAPTADSANAAQGAGATLDPAPKATNGKAPTLSPASDAQRAMVKTVAKQAGIAEDAIDGVLVDKFAFVLADMPVQLFGDVLAHLKAQPVK